jgi:drug/metabolite transporter (DMT)-like permease
MRLKPNLAADAALVATTLCWGSTFVIAKDVLTYWPPIFYLAFRFALAALALIVLFPKQIKRARTAEWRAGVTLGLLMGGGFALQAVGQIYTTASKSAFITGLTTPLVPFIAFFLLRARPSLENLIGITLASIGGAIILMPTEASVNTGDLVTLGCTVLFAAHITLLSVYARRIDVRQLTVLQIAAASLIFIFVILALHLCTLIWHMDALPQFVKRETAPLIWSTRVIWQMVYLAFVATVITFLLWTWGQARMSATHAAIIFSLEPVFATFFAVAVNGAKEWMGGRGYLGAMWVLAGVIVSELRFSARRKDVTPDAEDQEAIDVQV